MIVLEIYFLVSYIPKLMSRLARERNRSAVKWSLAGSGAWLGAEVSVLLGYGLVYELGKNLWGWPEQQPEGVLYLVYVVALVAAMVSADIVRRVLYAMPVGGPPQPPPPPTFNDAPFK